MKFSNKMLKQFKNVELVIALFFVLFLVSNLEVPLPLAKAIDTNIGKATTIILAISLFCLCNPIIAILAVVVALDLIKRSSVAKGTYIDKYTSSTETKKNEVFSKLNEFPTTLEEIVVNSLTPVVSQPGSSESNFESNNPHDKNETLVSSI